MKQAEKFDVDKFERELKEKMAQDLVDFKNKIRELAQSSQDTILLSINIEELNENDIVFFRKFEGGRLTLEDIARQERVLVNLEEAEAAKKLLAYMRNKLEANSGVTT